MPVKHFPAALFAFEDAEGFEGLEIFGGGLALGDAGFDEEADLAVGLGEDEFDEFLGVDLGGQFGSAEGQGFVEKVADGEDPAGGPDGGFFDAGEEEEDPGFPLAPLSDAAEEAVVFGFVLDKVPAEVEDGDAQEAGVDEEEDIEDASGSAVAIGEGMDGFELVVGDGHADQRVEVAFGAEEEVFEVAQFVLDDVDAEGRGVGDGLGDRVADHDLLVAAEADGLVAEDAAEVFHEVEPERLGLDGLESAAQGGAVTEDFLGGEVGRAGFVEGGGEEGVLGGDDVFDLGAELGFLKGDDVDQDTLIGDEVAGAFEFGEGFIGRDATLENGLGLELDGRREEREGVVGFFGVEGHCGGAVLREGS